jgi:hypothetical protein
MASWENDYSGDDPFGGLNVNLLRRLTFENKYLRLALQQGARSVSLTGPHRVTRPFPCFSRMRRLTSMSAIQ